MDDFFKNVTDCPTSTTLTDFDDNGDPGTPLKAPATLGSPFSNNDFMANIGDLRLYQAAIKANKEKCITPLVKEELRIFIEHKRCGEGKDMLHVDFNKPKHHQLTPDEITKRERRKEQNRRAALRCRMKKKDAKKKNEEEFTRLRRENKDLDGEVQKISQDILDLKRVLKCHISSGDCHISGITEDIRTDDCQFPTSISERQLERPDPCTTVNNALHDDENHFFDLEFLPDDFLQ
ncbi:uncharacterized protein LOC126821270 [Patella vulgata]|uniref:uncharacterized protein LOC126821270 n=1 Tax=Patella vulgata TaxID=6465 RepID=UPI0021808A0C|nr:uncharacterized protein LOC126821270 [Patella vulgata]